MKILHFSSIFLFVVSGLTTQSVEALYRGGYGGMWGREDGASTPLDAAKRDVRQLIQNAQALFAERENLRLNLARSKCLTTLTQKAQRLLDVLNSLEQYRVTERNTAREEARVACNDFCAKFAQDYVGGWGNDEQQRKVESIRDVLILNISSNLERAFAAASDDHDEHGDYGHHEAHGHTIGKTWPHVWRIGANGLGAVAFLCALQKVVQWRYAHVIARAPALGLGLLCAGGIYFCATTGWGHVKTLWHGSAIRRFFTGD